MHIKPEKATIIYLQQCIAVNYGIIAAGSEGEKEEVEDVGAMEGEDQKSKEGVFLEIKGEQKRQTHTYPSAWSQ